MAQTLQDLLLAEHSKLHTLRIVSWVNRSPDHLAELVATVVGEDPKLAQRAAWVLSVWGEAEPASLQPHLPQLLQGLSKPQHNAVPRAILRSLALMEIPEDFSGEVFDQAFRYLQSPQQPTAIRVCAMQVAFNLALPYPELRQELRLVLETHYPTGSAGFRSRAGKLLAKLAQRE